MLTIILTFAKYVLFLLILTKARAAVEQLKEELSEIEEKIGIELTRAVLENFKTNLCQIAEGLLLL